MARVVVGLSGGVDSSVAAHLLQEEGHEVIGIFMRNWNDESVTINNECPWIDDSNDAMMVAEHLGISFRVMDFSAEYKNRIVDYMFAEYERGRTPNPDVLCNREIKFDAFLEAALQLNADFVATGHYCRREVSADGRVQLLSGLDNNKDQSYFLCQVNQSQLQKALFPIGHLQKSEVREIANKIGLPTAAKKDSQGLCFVGKVKLPVFLQQQLAPKKGRILEIPREHTYYGDYLNKSADENFEMPNWPRSLAVEVGQHQGAHFYTIGQRKGLGVGGRAIPLFVAGIDTEHNEVFVAEGDDHPALLRCGLKIEKGSENWLGGLNLLENASEIRVMARIRYRQPLQPATLFRRNDETFLWFDEPQKAITPGQFAAWYQNEILLGSGIIV